MSPGDQPIGDHDLPHFVPIEPRLLPGESFDGYVERDGAIYELTTRKPSYHGTIPIQERRTVAFRDEHGEWRRPT